MATDVLSDGTPSTPAPVSNLDPYVHLKNVEGIDPGTDLDAVFAGSHDAAVLAVYDGDTGVTAATPAEIVQALNDVAGTAAGADALDALIGATAFEAVDSASTTRYGTCSRSFPEPTPVLAGQSLSNQTASAGTSPVSMR